jgi:hypothetical protein
MASSSDFAPFSPSFSPSDAALERYDHANTCNLPYARCKCKTIPRDLMPLYEPDTNPRSSYRPMTAIQALDQMDEVTISGAFMKLSGAAKDRYAYIYGPDNQLVKEILLKKCCDCQEILRVQALYQETATNVMASLWEMSDTTFDNGLQWLPREMLEDVWELVTKSYNGEIEVERSHNFTTAAYEFDYLAGGFQAQFLGDL